MTDNEKGAIVQEWFDREIAANKDNVAVMMHSSTKDYVVMIGSDCAKKLKAEIKQENLNNLKSIL